MRSSSERISVPLPTPEGPVMTKTRAKRLASQHRDELGALALREAADGLARRDAALLQHLVDLHAPVLRNREEHVEDLRRLDVVRGVEQQVMNAAPAGLQITLELCTPRADLVRSLERIHPLLQGSFRGSHDRLGRRLGRWRHGRRVYISFTDRQGPRA